MGKGQEPKIEEEPISKVPSKGYNIPSDMVLIMVMLGRWARYEFDAL